MKVIDPGRSYELSGGNGLVFRQEKDGWIVRDGTTNEEVVELLIQRVTEDYMALPCGESIRALHLLREALVALRERSARPAGADADGPGQLRIPVVELVDDRPAAAGPRKLEPRPPLPSALASAALAVCLHHRP